MLHENEVATRYQKIVQLMEWRRFQEAEKEALALIQDEPEDPDTYALLGNIKHSMERYDEALHWSEEALRRDPEHVLAWYVRANTYYEQENWKALKSALDEALRIDPYEPHYHMLNANLSNKKGKFEEAKEHMLKALDITPENAFYLAQMSYIEALLGNEHDSKRYEQESLRLEVESELNYLYLAWAADRRNDHEQYLLMLKNAIHLNPDNKQIREEYMEGLQKSYLLYRILLAPSRLAKRMKPWQILVSWFIVWIIFRPLVFIFIALYIIIHWTTKLLVHVKLFGWSFKR